MSEKEVIDLMESSKSEAEWNENCSKVKKACDGYPACWHPSIIASGLMERVANSFGSTAAMKIVGTSR